MNAVLNAITFRGVEPEIFQGKYKNKKNRFIYLLFMYVIIYFYIFIKYLILQIIVYIYA